VVALHITRFRSQMRVSNGGCVPPRRKYSRLPLRSFIIRDISALISHSAKVAAARANVQAISLDVAWSEWQTAMAAKLALYRVVALEPEVIRAKQIASDQQLTVDTLQAAVDRTKRVCLISPLLKRVGKTRVQSRWQAASFFWRTSFPRRCFAPPQRARNNHLRRPTCSRVCAPSSTPFPSTRKSLLTMSLNSRAYFFRISSVTFPQVGPDTDSSDVGETA
jgi:hypothetical protein